MTPELVPLQGDTGQLGVDTGDGIVAHLLAHHHGDRLSSTARLSLFRNLADVLRFTAKVLFVSWTISDLLNQHRPGSGRRLSSFRE
ncbi:MAG TPA: hypothetical protein VF174_00120 [Micromonosporaceae bacterium]